MSVVNDRLTSMSRFDEEITEPPVVADCAHCSGEIYAGDAVTRFEDGNVTHSDCEESYLRTFIATWGSINADGNVE